jgi:hypothetical protein
MRHFEGEGAVSPIHPVTSNECEKSPISIPSLRISLSTDRRSENSPFHGTAFNQEISQSLCSFEMTFARKNVSESKITKPSQDILSLQVQRRTQPEKSPQSNPVTSNGSEAPGQGGLIVLTSAFF